MLFRTLTLSIKLNLNPKSTSKALFSSSIAKMVRRSEKWYKEGYEAVVANH